MAVNARDIESLFRKITRVENPKFKNIKEFRDYLSEMVHPYNDFAISPNFDGVFHDGCLSIHNPNKLEYSWETLFILFEFLHMNENNTKFHTLELQHRDYQRLFECRVQNESQVQNQVEDQSKEASSIATNAIIINVVESKNTVENCIETKINDDKTNKEEYKLNMERVKLFTEFLEKCKIKTVRLRNIDIERLSKTSLTPSINSIECLLVDNIFMSKPYKEEHLELIHLLKKALKDNPSVTEFIFELIGKDLARQNYLVYLEFWPYSWEDQLLDILEGSSVERLKVTVNKYYNRIQNPIHFCESLHKIGVKGFKYDANRLTKNHGIEFSALGRALPSQEKELELEANCNLCTTFCCCFNAPFPSKHLRSNNLDLTKDRDIGEYGIFGKPIPPLKYLRHTSASERQQWILKDAEFLKRLALAIKNFQSIDFSNQYLFSMMARLNLNQEVDLSPLADNLKGACLVSLNFSQMTIEFAERKSLCEFLRVVLENENLRELNLSFNFILRKLSLEDCEMLGKWVRDSKLISLDLRDYFYEVSPYNLDHQALINNYKSFVKGLSENFHLRNVTLRDLKCYSFHTVEVFKDQFGELDKACQELLSVNQKHCLPEHSIQCDTCGCCRYEKETIEKALDITTLCHPVKPLVMQYLSYIPPSEFSDGYSSIQPKPKISKSKRAE